MPVVGKDVEKREPLCIVVGIYIGATTTENSMEVTQKIENRIFIWFSNSNSQYLKKNNSGYLSEENENSHWKDIYAPLCS